MESRVAILKPPNVLDAGIETLTSLKYGTKIESFITFISSEISLSRGGGCPLLEQRFSFVVISSMNKPRFILVAKRISTM